MGTINTSYNFVIGGYRSLLIGGIGTITTFQDRRSSILLLDHLLMIVDRVIIFR